MSAISGLNADFALQTAKYNASNVSSTEFENVLSREEQNVNDEEVMKACKEFETYFLQTMFKEMRKTVNKDESFIKVSQAEKMFQEELDNEYAKSMGEAGGVGLADMMYKQMKREDNGIKELE